MNEKFFVEVKATSDDSYVKAYANVTFESENGEFTITGFKVIKNDQKPEWVSMPTVGKKNDNGEYDNIPKISSSRRFKKNISDIILQKYEELE